MKELDGVISGAVAAPDFEVHAPLMSLPRVFGTQLDSIPGDTPYLWPVSGSQAPAELTACRKFRVGLVWKGNPGHMNDRNRSVPIAVVEKWTGIEGSQLFSLQVGRTSDDERWMSEKGVIDLAPHLPDFAATAACLAELDLLISVDTSVAHLAGALGRPVWTLLPTCNDWRWLRHREDTPWYPTMRLFRQEKLRVWEPVAERVATELRRECAQRS
jgi:hypothetical protein